MVQTASAEIASLSTQMIEDVRIRPIKTGLKKFRRKRERRKGRGEGKSSQYFVRFWAKWPMVLGFKQDREENSMEYAKVEKLVGLVTCETSTSTESIGTLFRFSVNRHNWTKIVQEELIPSRPAIHGSSKKPKSSRKPSRSCLPVSCPTCFIWRCS